MCCVEIIRSHAQDRRKRHLRRDEFNDSKVIFYYPCVFGFRKPSIFELVSNVYHVPNIGSRVFCRNASKAKSVRTTLVFYRQLLFH